jgi:hypothetical protein
MNLETRSYEGYDIEIQHDDGFGFHPRKDCDPLSVITSWDNSQRIDNEHDNQPHDDELVPEDAPFQTDEVMWQLRLNYYLFNVRMVAILPVYERYDGYSTSGSTRNQIGFIYMPKKVWDDNYNQAWIDEYHPGKKPKEIAEAILKGDIKLLDYYARGEIYGYNIPELGESCYGFFGNYDESGLLENAKSEIDYHIKLQKEKHFKKLKAWIKHKINLTYRYEFSFH